MKIFLDTSNLDEIRELRGEVDGFTTNPTLMRKANVFNYELWATRLVDIASNKPVSFEVIADTPDEIKRQAIKISGWGNNVYVKVPIVNSKGELLIDLIKELQADGIKLNVTALMSPDHIHKLELSESVRAIASVFAGRIANTSVDPEDVVMLARWVLPKATEILWASPREILNILHAEKAGADIITITPEMFRNYKLLKGKDLIEYSTETSKMFYDDANASGLIL